MKKLTFNKIRTLIFNPVGKKSVFAYDSFRTNNTIRDFHLSKHFIKFYYPHFIKL